MLLSLIASSLVATGAPVPPPPVDELTWNTGPFLNSLGRAASLEQMLVVYFWIDGSEHCVQLYQETLQSDTAARELAGFVLHSADLASDGGAQLVERYGVGVVPTLLFLTPQGDAEDAIVGFIGEADLAFELQRIRSGRETVSDYRARAGAAPDDLQARYDLALKLRHVGCTDEAQRLVDSIRAADPGGETVVGAQLHLLDLIELVRDESDDRDDPSTWDLRKVRAHVAKVKPDVVRFEGWNWIAEQEGARGERAAAVEAYRAAWKAIPDERKVRWTYDVLTTFWEWRDDLSRSDKRFFLAVAEELVERTAAPEEPEGEPAPAATPAEEEDEEVGFYRPFYLLSLSNALTLNGRERDAIAALERAIEIAPENEDLKRRLEELSGRATR